MLVILLTILLVLVCAYDLSVRSTRVWRMLSSQFPGEPALPLIGNALQLGTTAEEVQHNLQRIWNKYGRKNFRVMLGTEPILFVCEFEDIKIILSSTVEIQKSQQQIKFLGEYFGESLIISSDAAMGIRINAQSGGEHEYIKASRKITPLLIKRFYSPWYRYDFIYKHSALGTKGLQIQTDLENSVDKIIAQRREEFDKNIKPIVSSTEDVVDFISKNRTNLTFVDVMLLSKMPDGSPIPQEYIREEVNLMVFAGYDTTLATICFTLSSLAKYKDFQDKARQEQMEIFADDLNREPTSQDLNNMKYLQRFIKETMRHYPVASQFSRHIKNNLTLHDGKVIPAGTNIIFHLPGLHMNPDYFPNPEKFDPDRFLEPTSPYTYIPFSAGPRNCIGINFAWMSMRSLLSKILRNYELSLEKPEDEPQPVSQFILSSKNGYKVKIVERRNRSGIRK